MHLPLPRHEAQIIVSSSWPTATASFITIGSSATVVLMEFRQYNMPLSIQFLLCL
jgi:hypothetical protein